MSLRAGHSLPRGTPLPATLQGPRARGEDRSAGGRDKGSGGSVFSGDRLSVWVIRKLGGRTPVTIAQQCERP